MCVYIYIIQKLMYKEPKSTLKSLAVAFPPYPPSLPPVLFRQTTLHLLRHHPYLSQVLRGLNPSSYSHPPSDSPSLLPSLLSYSAKQLCTFCATTRAFARSLGVKSLRLFPPKITNPSLLSNGCNTTA